MCKGETELWGGGWYLNLWTAYDALLSQQMLLFMTHTQYVAFELKSSSFMGA